MEFVPFFYCQCGCCFAFLLKLLLALRADSLLSHCLMFSCISLLFFSFFFFSFLGHTAAFGSARASCCLGATAAGLHHSSCQRWIWAESVTYTRAQSNTGSLTYWVRPGIEPASSRILVGIISTEPQGNSCVSTLFIQYIFVDSWLLKFVVEDDYGGGCRAWHPSWFHQWRHEEKNCM